MMTSADTSKSVSFSTTNNFLSSSLHCTICFESFNLTDRTPVVLPCGHTFLCLPCSKRLTKCMECRTPLFFNNYTTNTATPAPALTARAPAPALTMPTSLDFSAGASSNNWNNNDDDYCIYMEPLTPSRGLRRPSFRSSPRTGSSPRSIIASVGSNGGGNTRSLGPATGMQPLQSLANRRSKSMGYSNNEPEQLPIPKNVVLMSLLESLQLVNNTNNKKVKANHDHDDDDDDNIKATEEMKDELLNMIQGNYGTFVVKNRNGLPLLTYDHEHDNNSKMKHNNDGRIRAAANSSSDNNNNNFSLPPPIFRKTSLLDVDDDDDDEYEYETDSDVVLSSSVVLDGSHHDIVLLTEALSHDQSTEVQLTRKMPSPPTLVSSSASSSTSSSEVLPFKTGSSSPFASDPLLSGTELWPEQRQVNWYLSSNIDDDAGGIEEQKEEEEDYSTASAVAPISPIQTFFTAEGEGNDDDNDIEDDVSSIRASNITIPQRRLEYGQRVQVISFQKGIAKLARGMGYVKACQNYDLVKIGDAKDKACKVEGQLLSLSEQRIMLRNKLAKMDTMISNLTEELDDATQIPFVEVNDYDDDDNNSIISSPDTIPQNNNDTMIMAAASNVSAFDAVPSIDTSGSSGSIVWPPPPPNSNPIGYSCSIDSIGSWANNNDDHDDDVHDSPSSFSWLLGHRSEGCLGSAMIELTSQEEEAMRIPASLATAVAAANSSPTKAQPPSPPIRTVSSFTSPNNAQRTQNQPSRRRTPRINTSASSTVNFRSGFSGHGGLTPKSHSKVVFRGGGGRY
mmetsp:Transcript_32562/g.36074  ORF Transcript_32562/g.36074 Transcript_32562/m.36074 type:complete len:791 (+) Transcript_32562:348-2720(+)